jgi:hypothetical protein
VTTPHENLANVTVGIFLKIKECEGGSSYIRVNTLQLYGDSGGTGFRTDNVGTAEGLNNIPPHTT